MELYVMLTFSVTVTLAPDKTVAPLTATVVELCSGLS